MSNIYCKPAPLPSFQEGFGRFIPVDVDRRVSHLQPLSNNYLPSFQEGFGRFIPLNTPIPTTPPISFALTNPAPSSLPAQRRPVKQNTAMQH